MIYNEENSKKIDEYINNNPEVVKLTDDDHCPNSTTVTLMQPDGTYKKQRFEVIKLPLHYYFIM